MKYFFAAVSLALIFFSCDLAFAAASTSLKVPFIWEIPDGVWVRPWNNACEEASIIMVDQFYLQNQKTFSKTEMKNLMWPLFALEDKLFGSNADTNSTRTAKLINYYSSFAAEVKTNPTLEEIKAELLAGHPVISLHYGYALNNPHHRFRRGGSSYHMMVITGFDDVKNEFIVNDPGLKNGLDWRYSYDIILSSLRDFNHTTKKADGAPVVLFTKPKQIVKAFGGRRLYLITDNKKYYISHPRLFGAHRWSWSIIKEVDKSWLDALESGPAITK